MRALLVPDSCVATRAAEMTDEQATAWIVGNVEPPADLDDYEPSIEDVRAEHAPTVECGCSLDVRTNPLYLSPGRSE